MTTATVIGTIPPITRTDAEALAATEYTRLVEQLRSLTAEDWAKQTDCPLWEVRAMAGHRGDDVGLHLVPLADQPHARRDEESEEDRRACHRCDDSHAGRRLCRPDQGRTHRPRRAGRTQGGALASQSTPTVPQDADEAGVRRQNRTWRMGYLLDTILTRDPWMHRIDIARATGRDLVLTPDHDGRIVADVVAEWARRHGQPVALTLTGPAGGEFVTGDGAGDHMSLDALEFCCTLSGRAAGSGLLTQQVPF